jgi:hypothetical protein
MRLNKIDTTARTSKICIKPERLYTKTPTTHPMIRITATMYKRDRIKNGLELYTINAKALPSVKVAGKCVFAIITEGKEKIVWKKFP